MNRKIGSRAVVALLLLGVTGPLAAQFPDEPPAPLPLKPLQFPPFQESRLDNGLSLIVVENHRLPVVSISLSLPIGTRHDPAGHEGLADMVAELITKGTERRTAEQIAEQIESVGASLNANAGNDFFAISTTVLTEHVPLAFDLLSDVVLNSRYPDAELELARTRTLSALRLAKSQPQALASRFFQRELYAPHPYGRYTSEASVQALDRASVREFAERHLRPDGGLLVLAGDISLNDARGRAQRAFGRWRGKSPSASAPPPGPAGTTEILLVHRPGSEQSNIRIGNLSFEPGAPVYFPAVVANKILGDGVDARLFMILRETKGWTYGAYSDLDRRRDVGYFEAFTEVRNAVTDSALVEVLAQLDRIRTEAVADSELTAAKGFLIGSFPLSIQTPQQIASQVATVKLYGLGEDHLRTYRQRIAQVTAQDVQRAAREVITPDSLVIVVVGDGRIVHDKLTPIAPVRIIDVDGNPLTPADLEPTAVPIDLDATQIVARRDSFQMTLQGNPIGSLVRETERLAGRWIIRDRFAIPMAGMQQDGTIELDAPSLDVISRREAGEMQGQEMRVDLTYGEGRVHGSAKVPQPGGTPKELQIDTTIAASTVDAEALEALLPALPLAEGASFTINAFSAERGTVVPATIRVAGIEQVTVPAGSFEAFRLDVQSGEEGSTVFVSRTSPRRIVKIELVGQPIVLELVK